MPSSAQAPRAMPATKATIVCARLMAFPRVEPRAAPQDFGRAAGLGLNDAGSASSWQFQAGFSDCGEAWRASGLTGGSDVMLYHSIMNATHHHQPPKLSRNKTDIFFCL